MCDYLLTKMYEEGLYSDINLTINGREYKLHKSLINRSLFFKTLIENIGIMSTSEEIEIKGMLDNLIDSQFIDKVLKWLYTNNNLDVSELIKSSNGSIDLDNLIQIYDVLNFLQIDETMNDMTKIINREIEKDNRSHLLLDSMTEKCVFNSKKDMMRNFYVYGIGRTDDECTKYDYCKMFERIHNDFKKIREFHDIIRIKKLGENICDMDMCEKFINCLYEEGTSLLIGEACAEYAPKRDKRCYILDNVLAYREYIIRDCMPNLCLIPQCGTKINDLMSAKILLDIVNDNNKAKVIELLDISNWYVDGKINLEVIEEVRNVCKEHNLEEMFNKKFKAFAFVYL